MVDRGDAETVDQAKAILIHNGMTPDYIATKIFQPALGEVCPGLCCDAYVRDGLIVVVRSKIVLAKDLELDWRDPRYPLTPENAGPLCTDCNKQKGDMPWSEFGAIQRAILANLEHVPPEPPPPEQIALF